MLRSARSNVTTRSSGVSGSGVGSALGMSSNTLIATPGQRVGSTTLSSSTGVGGNGSGGASSSGGGGGSSSSSSGISNSEGSMHPNLGLHNAAASGDVGLVKFALDNGQPHTSVLNGVLPLHAACSGGSEAVVRLLIAYGADVNAQRLKRKGSTIGPGTEGSTPLHFAAANGHVGVVRVLLEHGARPCTPDRDGLQAESLASANGHLASLTLLRSWTATHGPNGLSSAAIAGPSNGPGTSSGASLSPVNVTSSNAALRSQRSFEQITSAAAGVKASLLNRRKDNNSNMAKVVSNPNLKQNYAYSPEQLPPPPLPSVAGAQGVMHQWPSSPTINLTPVRSVSPLSTSDTEDMGFSSGMTLPASSGSASPLPAHLLPSSKESRRRPSLPSIFEKAAHPAASIRAALSGGGGNGGASSNAQSGASLFASVGGPDTIEELADGRLRSVGGSNNSIGGGSGDRNAVPPSPNRIAQRITGKRSLSNMLRKATGGGGSASSSSDVSAPPALPTLSPQRSRFDEGAMGNSTSIDSFGRMCSQHSLASLDCGDGNSARLSSAPATQGAFHLPPSPRSFLPSGSGSGSAANSTYAPSDSPEQRHQALRSTSSSSALHNRFDIVIPPFPRREGRRARSSSNNSLIRPSPISLDAGTSESTFRLAAKSSPTSPGLPPGSAGSQGTVLAAQQTYDYRPRKSSHLSSGTSPMLRFGEIGADSGCAAPPPSAPPATDYSSRTASASKAASGRRRAQSTADATPTSLTSSPRRALLAVAVQRAAHDDAQEFLGDDEAPHAHADAAGEHHDSHRLPDRLRNVTSTRSPRGSRPPPPLVHSASDEVSPSATRNGASSSQQSQTSNPPSPSCFGQARLPRHGSSSSLSAASSSSVQPCVVASSSASLGPPETRGSPLLSPRRYIESTPEESGARVAGGVRGKVQTRGSRSGSGTGSMASKASDASLRSYHVSAPTSSALEQAQAIFRQADALAASASASASDGKNSEGAAASAATPPLSLTQMLAAYGEALAMERKASSVSNATLGISSGQHIPTPAPPAQVRRQSSLASVSERPLARVSEHVPSTSSAVAQGGASGSKVTSPPPAASSRGGSGANGSTSNSTPPASPARFAKTSAGEAHVRLPSMPMLPAAGMGPGETGKARSVEEKDGRARKNLQASKIEDHTKPSSPMSSNLPLPSVSGATTKMSGGSMDSGRQHLLFSSPATSMAAPPRAALVGRASEDLLRSGRYGNTAAAYQPSPGGSVGPTAPSTPLMEGRFVGPGMGNSPLSAPAHRHSPSLPTEFSYGRSGGTGSTTQTIDGHSMGEGRLQAQQALSMLHSSGSFSNASFTQLLHDDGHSSPFGATYTPISRTTSNVPSSSSRSRAGSGVGSSTGVRSTQRSGSDISAATFLLPAPDFDPYASPALSSHSSGGAGKDYAESVGSAKTGKKRSTIKSFLTSIKR